MQVVDLLRRARDRAPIEPEALHAFIRGVAEGSVPDYQASAFLMAVCINGLPDALTAELTLAIRDSGRVIDLAHVDRPKVDKHSTGGVGDKISLPLAPMVAACGVAVPM